MELNSETYAVKVAVVRGASTRVAGRPWVNAPTVQRFVTFPALATDLSHLVSGWKQTGTAGGSLIGSSPLVVFHSRPSWYTLDDDAWTRYPNASNTTESLLEVCVGFCARAAYGSDAPAEYMQLDATRGSESCSCYAHVAGNETSIAPPSDVDALEWLGTAARVRDRPVHIYAMHATDMSSSEYVGDLGGTLEYETLVEPGFDVSGVVEGAAPSEADSQLECLRRCAVELDVALRAVRYEPDTTPNVPGKCRCYSVDVASWDYDEGWTHTPGSTVRWLRTRFCDGVAHRANDRTTSVLWSKATGGWCRGQPVGGYVLSASTVEYDATARALPDDVACRLRCEHDRLRNAQVFVPTWESLQLIRMSPPPPSPPAPPAPPPPPSRRSRRPPLAPPSNATAYRTWHPRTERGEVPTTDENGEFAATCGIGSCDFSAAVFSGSQMVALDVAVAAPRGPSPTAASADAPLAPRPHGVPRVADPRGLRPLRHPVPGRGGGGQRQDPLLGRRRPHDAHLLLPGRHPARVPDRVRRAQVHRLPARPLPPRHDVQQRREAAGGDGVERRRVRDKGAGHGLLLRQPPGHRLQAPRRRRGLLERLRVRSAPAAHCTNVTTSRRDVCPS